MAGQANDGAGNMLIGFLLGATLVGVAILGVFLWDNYKSHGGGAAPAASITVKKGAPALYRP